MAVKFGDTQLNVRGISEERGFTNPHVRFRKIRGRIVPIINKKRIGQDVSDIGESKIKIGLAVGSASLIKRTNYAKKLKTFSEKFNLKIPSFKPKSVDGKKVKFAKKSFSLASKTLGKSVKHSGKLGLLLAASGLATKIMGDELQMRSPFGKDFFFVKDRQGRDS